MVTHKWILAAATALTFSFTSLAGAQSFRTIDPGTTIGVRTNEEIRVRYGDGRVFSGTVNRDVRNRGGGIAIPKGSQVELLVRNISRDEMVLDLESVDVRGQRFGIEGEDNVDVSDRPGVGDNRRTGEFVGGGAAIGAIIGAIAGGGKGAVIGGAVGAGGGAGLQIVTRGRNVEIPAESLITFRLERPLRMGYGDRGGFNRDGQHYHPGYDVDRGESPAFQEGRDAGRSDSDRNEARNARNERWSRAEDARDYERGYDQAYRGGSGNARPESRPDNPPQMHASLQIGADDKIIWDGAPPNAQIYVQMDSTPKKLFASGASGAQMAPWIARGHLYLFILQDARGNEIARAQTDLRSKRDPR
jgi:hypothetical protein